MVERLSGPSLHVYEVPRIDQVGLMYGVVSGRKLAKLGTVCRKLDGIDDEVVERAELLAAMLARYEDL